MYSYLEGVGLVSWRGWVKLFSEYPGWGVTWSAALRAEYHQDSGTIDASWAILRI